MRRLMTVLIFSSLTLAGCSGFRDSRANPANWFGKSSTVEHTSTAANSAQVNPLIPEQSDSIFARKSKVAEYVGTPIHTVQTVTVERSSGGGIVKATGVSLRQGAYDVRLWPENNGEPVNGVLTYTLRAVQRADTAQGPEQTRRVSAGQFVASKVLDDVREIRVQGLNNTVASSR